MTEVKGIYLEDRMPLPHKHHHASLALVIKQSMASLAYLE